MQDYNRRQFIRLGGLGLSAAFLPPIACCDFSRKRPNILFIMSDDHAYQAIGCYGNGINQTPQIDRLARDGVRFEQSFCTNSICAPSRAVLLTGKHSHINGQIDNRQVFDGSQPTFPRLLQQAGYQTAVVGKWHLKSDPTGFDYWNILPDQGHYYNPDFIEMGIQKQITGYVTDLITDTALRWLDQRDPSRPFCLLLHHKAPHRNWMPNIKHLHLYDDVDIPIPESFFDDYATRGPAARNQEMEIARHMFIDYDLKMPGVPDPGAEPNWQTGGKTMWENDFGRLNDSQKRAWLEAYEPVRQQYLQVQLHGQDLARWKYQRYLKDYLRCIASVDDNVGRVLDYLDENGLSGNTLVVYTSDQGFYLGEHGWFDKRFMYEQSLRMPLILRYPGKIKSGVNKTDLVQNLDFAPTFLDFAGVLVPAEIQGRSMRALLSGKTPTDWRQAIYYHYYEYPSWHMVRPHYGIRTRRYKLMHFYGDLDTWELYDLQTDPHELNNCYDHPDYASVVQELKVELKALKVKYQDSVE